jgi:hypothetical protein
MPVLIGFGILIVLVVLSNNKRHKEHDESFDAFIGDMNKNIDSKLDAALKRAKEIANENGVDFTDD